MPTGFAGRETSHNSGPLSAKPNIVRFVLDVTAEVKHLSSYRKNPTDHARSNVEGQLYQLHCYEKIVSLHKKGEIIASNFTAKAKYTAFKYTKYGEIFYSSNGIDLAEFDILGIQDKKILWFESTKSSKNMKPLELEVRRKKSYLKKLFPEYEVQLTILSPLRISRFEPERQLIIKEPDYDSFLKRNRYQFPFPAEYTKPLAELDELASRFDYIRYIAEVSDLFFNEKNLNLRRISKEGILERLYDYRSLQNGTCEFYDVEKGTIGKIEVNSEGIFKDGERVKGIKKTHKEVKCLMRFC